MSLHLPGPGVRVIACGNADRGDDGAALATIAALIPTLPHGLLAGVEIRRSLELRVEDLLDLPANAFCLIVDAVVGVEPGRIVQVALDELAGRPAFSPRSSHQLPIDLVVRLAGVLRNAPVSGTFVGLSGDGFGYGAPLSPVVRAAMPAFQAAIASELAHLVEHAREAATVGSPPIATPPVVAAGAEA